MNQKLQNKLFKKYPKLLKINNPPQTPFDQWKIECGDGWYGILDNLFDFIQNKIDNCYPKIKQVNILQIKEKFSTLRIYTNYSNQEIDGAIDFSSHLSSKICEFCGDTKTTKLRKEGWLKTLCNECNKNRYKDK